MKKIYLLLPLWVLLVGAVHAQTQPCNCLITPFRPTPPCFDVCTCSTLARTNIDQLVRIVGLREDTARRIVGWDGRFSARSLQEFSVVLNQGQMEEVSTRLNSLSREQLRLLNGTSGGFGGGGGGGGSRITGGSQVSNTPGLSTSNTAASSASATTSPPIAAITYYYAEDSKDKWTWKVKATDGRIIAVSKGSYETEAECLADIDLLKNSSGAEVKKE